MKIYPDFRYWLGGVYVNEEFRRKGIASLMIRDAIDKARELNVQKLFLQTEKLYRG